MIEICNCIACNLKLCFAIERRLHRDALKQIYLLFLHFIHSQTKHRAAFPPGPTWYYWKDMGTFCGLSRRTLNEHATLPSPTIEIWHAVKFKYNTNKYKLWYTWEPGQTNVNDHAMFSSLSIEIWCWNMLTNTNMARENKNIHIQGTLLQGEVKKMNMGKGIICPNFHLAAVVVIKYRDEMVWRCCWDELCESKSLFLRCYVSHEILRRLQMQI